MFKKNLERLYQDPQFGMIFGVFLLHKTKQKALLWGSWYRTAKTINQQLAPNVEHTLQLLRTLRPKMAIKTLNERLFKPQVIMKSIENHNPQPQKNDNMTKTTYNHKKIRVPFAVENHRKP